MQTPIRPFTDPAATQVLRLGDFAEMCRLVAVAKGALLASRMAGVSPRIREALVKASIPALGGAGSAESTALTDLGQAFLTSLRSIGVFDQMLPAMLGMPSNVKITIASSGMIAVETAPGRGKVVTSASLNIDMLNPTKVAALIVLSDQLANQPLAAGFIAREMRNAVGAASDQAFLSAMISSTVPIASSGSSAANTISDFDALLGGLTAAAATSKLFIIHSPTSIKKLMSKTLASGGRAWPDLHWPSAGIDCGEMSGIRTLMSDQLPSNTALAIDAAAIAADGGTVTIDRSTEAALQMDTAPTNASTGGSPAAPVPTTLVSLFQTNSVAVRAERNFAYRLLRSGAASSLSGVAY